ncbi:MAG: MotA/TolQ/ExbB proton channel family protein [Phycisphaeraceae bacterium]
MPAAAILPAALITPFTELMARGGIAMWPLLLLSIVSLTLLFERTWFFIRINRPGQLRLAARLGTLLRQDDRDQARTAARDAPGLYAAFVADLLLPPVSEASALDVIERHRRRIERFLPTLSTIITAAPMLGILGTVLGIIASFDLLGARPDATDPRQVSQGIAEALLTTAAGLVIAVFTLFPYNAFRAQIDRTLARLEALAAAATSATKPGPVVPSQADARSERPRA